MKLPRSYYQQHLSDHWWISWKPQQLVGNKEFAKTYICISANIRIDWMILILVTNILHPSNRKNVCTGAVAQDYFYMFSLMQTNPKPAQNLIENNFDGNICRCTGYRPILDAMKCFSCEKSPSSGDIEVSWIIYLKVLSAAWLTE